MLIPTERKELREMVSEDSVRVPSIRTDSILKLQPSVQKMVKEKKSRVMAWTQEDPRSLRITSLALPSTPTLSMVPVPWSSQKIHLNMGTSQEDTRKDQGESCLSYIPRIHDIIKGHCWTLGRTSVAWDICAMRYSPFSRIRVNSNAGRIAVT